MAKSGRRTHWKKVMIAWLISIAILVVLMLKTDVRLRHIFEILKLVDPVRLAGIFVISAAFHVLLGAYKWTVVLRGIGCSTTYLETLFVRMGSDPIRFVMPLKTGELSNMLYYSRTGKLPFAESVSWVLFDKALNFLGTLIWLGVGIAIYGSVPDAIRWPVMAVGGVLVLLLIVPKLAKLPVKIAGKANAKLGRVTDELLITFERIRPVRRLWLVVLATVFQLRPLIVCFLLFGVFLEPVFKSRPDVPEMLAKGPVVMMASNVPGTVHGLGPRETALVEMFGKHLDENARELSPMPAKPATEVKVALPDGVKPMAPALPPDLERAAPSLRPEFTRSGPRLVGLEAPLVAIGILMAIAIHLVPAICGLPLMAPLLTAIEEGGRDSAPETDDVDDMASGEGLDDTDLADEDESGEGS